MGLRITADTAANSTKVIDVETGVEIKNIRKILLQCVPGGIWEAQLTVIVSHFDVVAAEKRTDVVDVTRHGGGQG